MRVNTNESREVSTVSNVESQTIEKTLNKSKTVRLLRLALRLNKWALIVPDDQEPVLDEIARCHEQAGLELFTRIRGRVPGDRFGAVILAIAEEEGLPFEIARTLMGPHATEPVEGRHVLSLCKDRQGEMVAAWLKLVFGGSERRIA
jgi:hypothetical protein